MSHGFLSLSLETKTANKGVGVVAAADFFLLNEMHHVGVQ
jgi:hypothetical protein